MRIIKMVLLAAFLCFVGSSCLKAQMETEYQAALETIVDGGHYQISTMVGSNKYFLTSLGYLSASAGDAGVFQFMKVKGKEYEYGFKLMDICFTYPNLSNGTAVLNSGHINTNMPTTPFDTWEAQVFFQNEEGKFAIRATNAAGGESGLALVAKTFWTVNMDSEGAPKAEYSFDVNYVWLLEEVSTINVTYEVYDGATKIACKTVAQEPNSEVAIPPSLTGWASGNIWRPYACYEYSTSGIIGDSDCTITVTRSIKDGVVQTLSDLTNTKAYTIRCDRGALCTKDGYLASTAHRSLTNAYPGTFAIINYEGHYYLFSVADKKFVTNDGSLSAIPTNGVNDAIVMEAKTSPYFFYYFSIDGTNKGLNTNGDNPYGYVINNWMNVDAGNQYYMIEEVDFDGTDALAILDSYFHQSYIVNYVVKDTKGSTLFTSEAVTTTLGAKITTLPTAYRREYCTYNEVDVTISDPETIVEFTATWTGPFELSESYETAHWYDMAVRGDWYVTSDSTDADGALSTVNADAMGLAEDAYQWAFVGDPYHIKIYNKAEGSSKVFSAQGAMKNQGIPTFQSDDFYWNIIPSTSTIANSFLLNVSSTNLSLNQYGGGGGSLKFWNTTYNINDIGSAFRVFDVPDDFAEYVVTEITPYMEDDKTGFFTFTDEAKTAIGYDPDYKVHCPFSAYKAMKSALLEILADANSLNLPLSGYYRIDISTASQSSFNGHHTFVRNVDGRVETHYQDDSFEGPNTIIQVEVNPDNAIQYAFKLQGKYITATGYSFSGNYVGFSDEPFYYTLSIENPGYGIFQGHEVSEDGGTSGLYLNSNSSGYMIGGLKDLFEFNWEFFPATSFPSTIGETGYTTLYVPFPVTLPEGVQAYIGKYVSADQCLYLMDAGRVIPAATAVVLKGESGTYDITIGGDAESVDNDLQGTYTETDISNAQNSLQVDRLGNYLLISTGTTLEANSAYILAQSGTGTRVSFESLEQMCSNLQEHIQTLAANYESELSSEGKTALSALMEQVRETYAAGDFSRSYMTTLQQEATNVVASDICSQLTLLANIAQDWLQTNLSADIYKLLENRMNTVQSLAGQQASYYLYNHSSDIAEAKANLKESFAQAEEYAEMLEHLTDDLPVDKDLTPLIANYDFGIGGYYSSPIRYWQHGTFRIMDYAVTATGTWRSAVAEAYTSYATLADNYLFQTIELPAGTYQLEADVISNGTKGVFLVTECGTKKYSIEGVAKATAVQHLVRPFDHAGGSLTVGIRIENTDASNVCVDNFSLKVIAPLDQSDLQLLKRMQEQLADQPDWTSPWDIDNDPWMLDGVRYTDNQVTGLSLSNHHFTGNLPTAIFELPHLKTVDLTVNEFSGDLAQLLQPLIQQGKTSPVTFINMGANQLTGDISVIGQVCPTLERLYAAENHFSSVSSPLPSSLRVVDLSDQTLTQTLNFDLPSATGEDIVSQLPTILFYNHEQRSSIPVFGLQTVDDDMIYMIYNLTGDVEDTEVTSEPFVYRGQSGDILMFRSITGAAMNSTLPVRITFEQGDANFDGWLDVSDLQAIISYIFGTNITPDAISFNYTAANLYDDERINVQDVVAMVNLLLDLGEPTSVKRRVITKRHPSDEVVQAYLFWRGRELVLSTTVPVSAADIQFSDSEAISWKLQSLGFTIAERTNSQGFHTVIYSLTGAELPVGETVIARRMTASGSIAQATLSDSHARRISVALSEPVTDNADFTLQPDESWSLLSIQGVVIGTGAGERALQALLYAQPHGIYLLHTVQGKTIKFTHK